MCHTCRRAHRVDSPCHTLPYLRHTLPSSCLGATCAMPRCHLRHASVPPVCVRACVVQGKTLYAMGVNKAAVRCIEVCEDRVMTSGDDGKVLLHKFM